MANKLKTEKKVAVISMLCEGTSIRAAERITGDFLFGCEFVCHAARMTDDSKHSNIFLKI